MDTILKKNVALLLFVSLNFVVYSQQADYQQRMDSIFIIPAYKVTTGLLINRSPAIIEMQDFKLQPNTDNITVINALNWLELFYRIYGSHLNMNSFAYDIMLAHKYLNKTADEQIPLGLIFYRYDKIKNNAIPNGLLSVDTVRKKITDISPAGQSPLEIDTCFAASSLVDTITVGINAFILKDSLIVSNQKSDIQEIYVDFDNGRGYVRVYPNQPVTVSFSAMGNKTLTTKMVVGAKNYYASSRIYVKNASPQFASLASSGIPTPDVPPTQYINNGIEAYYGIWYRCNHDNTIRKPILIVSGFDPNDINRIAGEESEGKPKAYIYQIANKDRFLDRLREQGYDIIIYRSANSTMSVIDNAMNLVNFMQERIINVKTSDIELIVMGVSMGGLVCRYALTYMEHYNIPHKTKLFLSMDSPQNGANIPLGVQFWIDFLNQDLLGIIPALKDALNNLLDGPAAKEMLIYHHTNSSDGTARCATDRTAYLNNLALIGNFPRKCTTMAISMGSGIGADQGFAAGANLIKKTPSPAATGALFTLDRILELFGIPPIGFILNHFSWEFEVNAVPDHTLKSIYKETLTLDGCFPVPDIKDENPDPPIILTGWDCNPHLINRDIQVNNTMPLDNAPGSIIGIHNLATVISNDFIITLLDEMGVAWFDPNYDCFIPAFSALGLNVPPNTNIKSYLNTSAGVTRINDNFYLNTNKTVSPFDYLYIENTNLHHIYDEDKTGVFTPEMFAAIDSLAAPFHLLLENKTILSGESVAYEAENVTVSNVTVKSGGSLEISAKTISVQPEFNAELGSTVNLKVDSSWICPVAGNGK